MAVCRVGVRGPELRAGELGKSLVIKGIRSFIHSFNIPYALCGAWPSAHLKRYDLILKVLGSHCWSECSTLWNPNTPWVSPCPRGVCSATVVAPGQPCQVCTKTKVPAEPMHPSVTLPGCGFPKPSWGLEPLRLSENPTLSLFRWGN